MSLRKLLFILLPVVATLSQGLAKETRVETFKVGDSPSLELNNVSGDIEIEHGPDNEIRVEFTRSSDDIRVEIKQSSDTVEIRTIYPKKIGFRAKSGGVSYIVSFPKRGNLEVASVSGEMVVRGIDGEIELKTVSGSLSTSDLAGDLEVKSISGNVVLNRVHAKELEAMTISGNLSYNGNLSGNDYEFSSTSGNITISHSNEASYQISGRTISGSITNRVGDEISVIKEKWGPLKSLEGRYGGGDAEVEVNTVSGNITLSID